MIDERELKLLISLLKEIDKVGVKTFTSLCQKLSGSNLQELENISKLLPLRSSKTKKPINYNTSTEALLSDVEDKKRLMIQDILRLIKSKKVVKNLSQYSNYLNTIGVHVRRVTNWDEGSYLLTKELKEKSYEAISVILEDLSLDIQDDRSLESWSKIILKKDNDKIT